MFNRKEKEEVTEVTEEVKAPKAKTFFRSKREAKKYLAKVSRWVSKTLHIALNKFDDYSTIAVLALSGLLALSILAVSIFGFSPLTIAIFNALFYATLAVDIIYISRVLYLTVKYVLKGPAALKRRMVAEQEVTEETVAVNV